MASNYELVYDIENINDETFEERYQNIRSRDILLYRLKTIKSGKIIETEIYPLYAKGVEQRAKKARDSKNSQKNLNEENSYKYFMRKVHTNFTNKDIHISLTYDDNNLVDKSTANKDIRNYFCRVKRYCKKHKLGDIKYMYVTEWQVSIGVPIRIHHHIIINGIIDRDVLESIWGKGHCNADRLKFDKNNEIKGLTTYLLKQKRKKADETTAEPDGYLYKTKKRWSCSQNLKNPQVTTSDYKISKKKVLECSINHHTAKEFLDKLFINYISDEIKVKFSDDFPGVFIHTTYLPIPPLKKSKINKSQKVFA